MPMHPAPPHDLHGLVEAFAHTAQAVIDLGHSVTDAELRLPTECPGWTVQDQIAHVVGVEAFLEGHREPHIELPAYPHIKNELGKRVEYAVEARRGRSRDAVVAELEHVLAQRLSTLRSPGLTESSIIPGPFGPDAAATVAMIRALDVWTHEQDIRTAIGRPGNLDSPAAAVFTDAVLTELPKLVAKHAGIEPGRPVIIDVTGPVLARAGVRVEINGSGRPRGHAMFGGEHQLPRETHAHTGGPTTTITLSTDAFTRRAAGRRSVAETAYSVVGDESIARRVLQALVITH